MMHPREYRGQEIVVLGLAKSGQAVAKVFHEAGARVTVNDAKPKNECLGADELEALGIRVICGGHPDDVVHGGTALLVKNPGIPYSVAPVRKAAELGIDIVTEVEVAWHLCQAPIIGITGSNGKTTTTTWVGNMLDLAGKQPIVAGNIGRPLCDAARDSSPDKWMVVELSSFQLKGTTRFRPQIACLLNVYATHLDYHGDMEDYIASKAKLFENQTPEDIAVLNWDDEICRRLSQSLRARIVPFSAKQSLDRGVYVEQGQIVCHDERGERTEILPVREVGIPGKHNLENALAAAAVALSAGIDAGTIAASLQAFRGVEHRQEFVRELGGVRFYNDSKATNPAATIKAIDAFEAPIVWIGGGLDRGMDYAELLPWFAERVKAAVLIGETRHKLERAARRAGLQNVYVVDTSDKVSAADALEQAVRLAYQAAEQGDVVLFSPACASWDMFASYEERGRMFKASAHNL